jgi:hypothetical protein
MKRNIPYLILVLFFSLQIVACSNCGGPLEKVTASAPKMLMLANAREWTDLSPPGTHFGPGPYHLIGQNEKGLFYVQEQINRNTAQVTIHTTTTSTISRQKSHFNYEYYSGVCVPHSAISATPILSSKIWGTAYYAPRVSYKDAIPHRMIGMPKPGIFKPVD